MEGVLFIPIPNSKISLIFPLHLRAIVVVSFLILYKSLVMAFLFESNFHGEKLTLCCSLIIVYHRFIKIIMKTQRDKYSS